MDTIATDAAPAMACISRWQTPDGAYRDRDADWVIAADGARSPLRGMLGLGFEGRVFEDHFLIVDVRMRGRLSNRALVLVRAMVQVRGSSALLHKQPDGIWRIDFQLGWPMIDQRGRTGRRRG